ncbi:MAG TPA: quinolinate synthase NadA [Nocardioidaceae bacterium]|nr:quinolinate synthase NadA [Nocardioidaceae bacterium]
MDATSQWKLRPATPQPAWQHEVRRLADKRDAVVLAHNYMRPEIQDVADHVGDSLALSRIAAGTDAGTIVFCGVHFMAETAKILSPDKTVLVPTAEAGCSLADTIDAAAVRAWKAEHPDAVVVAYVNTAAEVKAEADICCTSSNAVQVVESIDPDTAVLFLPDQFLGAHVRRQTGRTNIEVWLGECHVHAGISPTDVRAQVAAHPDAELLVHPECGCASSALWLAGEGGLPADRTHIVSTGGMVSAARTMTAPTALVATEVGMLHQLRKANDRTRFLPMNPQASCRYMKMTTPELLLRCLREGRDEIDVPADVAARARRAVERMVAVGTPGGGE